MPQLCQAIVKTVLRGDEKGKGRANGLRQALASEASRLQPVLGGFESMTPYF